MRTPINSGPQKRCTSETRKTGRFACHEPVFDGGSVRGGLKRLPARPGCRQNEPETEPPGEQANELALSRNHGPIAGRLHRGWRSSNQSTDGWYELGNGVTKRLTIQRHAERPDPVKRVAERPPVEDRTQHAGRRASAVEHRRLLVPFRTHTWKTRSNANSENAASWAPAPGAPAPRGPVESIFKLARLVKTVR